MKENSSGGIVDRIWEVFSSMKTGLVLLGALAVTAGIGTFFPQIAQDPARAEAVGGLWKALGFTHLYSTLWFQLLLGLICLNLVVCSLQRLSGTYRRTFKPAIPQSSAQVPQRLRAQISGEQEILQAAARRILESKGYRFSEETREDGQWGFVAQKHRLGHWGAFATHVAFVVLIVGALIGNLLGFKGYFMAGTGELVPLDSINLDHGRVRENFSVRINSAEDRFLPNGERDNWYTDLSILENGKEVARQTLSVNHPFTYQGVTFYQASFANGVRFTANVKGQNLPLVLQEGGGNYFQAPGTDLYLIVSRVMRNGKQPAAVFQVYNAKGMQPVQTGQLTPGQTADILNRYRITMDGLAGYTGLQVKKDPGVPLIWFGSILLLAGLMLSFYWRPRVIAGLLERNGVGAAELVLGAVSGKHTDALSKELAEILQEFGTLAGVALFAGQESGREV